MPNSRCFMMMPFKGLDAVYQAAVDAMRSVGITLERADQEPMPGVVVEKIKQQIRQSSFCVADLTGSNPNVYLELGWAEILGREVILITQGDLSSLPFDVQHRRVIRYGTSNDELVHLQAALAASVRSLRGVLGGSIRSLLLPKSVAEDTRRVLAASPISYREAKRSREGFSNIRPSIGDNAGIRHLLCAFDRLGGGSSVPDLVSPGDFKDSVLTETAASFFLIGSPRANHWTGDLLSAFNARWLPRIAFAADPDSPDLRDVRVRVLRDSNVYLPDGFVDTNRRQHDFGFIIRGPNPWSPGHMFLIIAGRTALGTHAVAAACVNESLISHVADRLAQLGITFDNHKEPFCAVCEVSASPDNLVPDDSTLRLLNVFAHQPSP